MKFKELKRLNLEDYYWRLVFGRSSRRGTFFELRASGFRDLPAPVFFLSTGRCGTNWMADLLACDKSLKVFHEPKPNLGIQGKTAYEIYTQTGFTPDDTAARLLEEIVLTGREQYLRYSWKTQRRLVETNNHITFMAPAIHSLFPEAKFVHLNRHPGEFVRSALRRNFYNNVDDIKRIVPVQGDTAASAWEGMGQLEKNCWLWSATNDFIERCKAIIPAENLFYFDFNRLNAETVEQLCRFLGADPGRGNIERMLRKQVNVQQTGRVAAYDQWEQKDREALGRLCGSLAGKYHYQL